jgi:hypothetical protein
VDTNSPTGGPIPQSPNNNGVLITPLLLPAGQTDQDDTGEFSNQPQQILRNCGTVSRIQINLSDFSGQNVLSQYSGVLYLKLKLVTGPDDMYSPAKRADWQNRLRDGYVGDGFF